MPEDRYASLRSAVEAMPVPAESMPISTANSKLSQRASTVQSAQQTTSAQVMRGVLQPIGFAAWDESENFAGSSACTGRRRCKARGPQKKLRMTTTWHLVCDVDQRVKKTAVSQECQKLRVMLVDDDQSRLEMVEQALLAEGHQVVAKFGTACDLSAALISCQPQIIFIDVDAAGRETLESLSQLNRDHPRPIVLFAARSDAETIRRAVQAGVSAYVVDGLQPNRIGSVLEVAIARFEMHQALQKDLSQARSRLADQRDIQRAKGIIMKRRKLDENEAFVMLRKMAMDRKQRLGDFARTVLSLADAF